MFLIQYLYRNYNGLKVFFGTIKAEIDRMGILMSTRLLPQTSLEEYDLQYVDNCHILIKSKFIFTDI